MKKVIVIGGGASGLMASYASAMNGNDTILIEKNEKLGKKIYITGKGRCNLSNYIEVEDFLKNIVTNPKFMLSSIYTFTPQDTMDFFEKGGLPLKVERGNRVFPLSNKASDVTKCLEKYCKNAGVKINLNETVLKINIEENTVKSVFTTEGSYECDAVIVCTGGISYSSTGSTGDGYKFAREAKHNVTPLKTALVGLNLKGDFFKDLQGVSLKNVALSAEYNGKRISNEFGEMLFTHFGISGPIVLSTSSLINKLDLTNVKLYLDLKPALDFDTLDKRLLREFDENKNKKIENVLHSLLPQKLILPILKQANLKEDKQVNSITKEKRKSLIESLKSFSMTVQSLRGFEEAIITSGGVDVKQINPKTMESKLVGGLYFAGEVLDVDAYTGGFNLQIAWSTGYVAGNSIKD